VRRELVKPEQGERGHVVLALGIEMTFLKLDSRNDTGTAESPRIQPVILKIGSHR
jgi:hypothetical protein